MAFNLVDIWKELEEDYSGAAGIYRLIDIRDDVRVRIAVLAPTKKLTMLIQLDGEEMERLEPPSWRGLVNGPVAIDFNGRHTKQLKLQAKDDSFLPIFEALCNDIVRDLEIVENRSAPKTLQECFNRWTAFFEKAGMDGLSREDQRGLFGELHLINRMLIARIAPIDIVSRWMGPRGTFRDFIKQNRAFTSLDVIRKMTYDRFRGELLDNLPVIASDLRRKNLWNVFNWFKRKSPTEQIDEFLIASYKELTKSKQ